MGWRDLAKAVGIAAWTGPRDDAGAGIRIVAPVPGSRVENEEGETKVSGRISFEAREAAGYEIVIAVDVSGSTWQPAGIDVDGDGIVGVPLGIEPAGI